MVHNLDDLVSLLGEPPDPDDLIGLVKHAIWCPTCGDRENVCDCDCE